MTQKSLVKLYKSNSPRYVRFLKYKKIKHINLSEIYFGTLLIIGSKLRLPGWKNIFLNLTPDNSAEKPFVLLFIIFLFCKWFYSWIFQSNKSRSKTASFCSETVKKTFHSTVSVHKRVTWRDTDIDPNSYGYLLFASTISRHSCKNL